MDSTTIPASQFVRLPKCHGQMRRPPRHGAAVVEFAVCLPIFVLLVVTAIEATSMIYTQQSLKIAAYESARVALIPEIDARRVQAQCRQVLDDRRVRGASIEIDPPDISQADVGEFVTVTVHAPFGQSGRVGNWFFGGRQITASAVVMKEF